MASSISSSPSLQTPDVPNQAEDKYTAFVEKRLQQTAGHVKLVDLFGGLMFLLGGLIAGLLALAVVDAWLFELGSPVRLIALLAIIAVTAWFLTFRIAPLLLRRINPAYAAKMIEDGHPELKNSLINHVFFQQDPTNARRIINRAMSRKAAEDISTVTIETAVDRSHMIRAAIFFVAALAIFGLYKVVSPKDPFKTVARIVAPLADITRPSRIDISQIEPGDAEVFFGESVEVMAVVDGLGRSESAFIVFSTDDGQARDKRIPMKSPQSDGRYRAILSAGDSGIQQNLTYRISAGDATSRQFLVTVKPRPSFVVQNVHIKPPAYTRLEPFSQKHGNVASVEGAEITVEALANLPVQSAFVQLLAIASEKEDSQKRAAEEFKEPSIVESIPMIVDEETRAHGTFRLQMRGDRVTPRFTHYRIGFLTADGTQNNNPAVFRIRTTPDLKPEIEILSPEETEVAVAENGVLKMSIRAIDPDYEVTDIRLVGDSHGVSLFDKTIFGENVSAPRVELFYSFRPDEFGLRAGQEALLQSVAFDNRQSAVSDVADPNQAKSRQILVRIDPPQENSTQENSDEPKDRGDEDQKQPDQKQSDQKDPRNNRDESTQNQNDQNQNDQKQSGTKDSDEQKNQTQDSSASDSESGEQKQSQNKDGSKPKSDQEKSDQSEQNESQDSNSKQQNSSGDSDSNSKQQSQSNSSDSGKSGEQTADQSNSGETNNQTGESGREPMNSRNNSGEGTAKESSDQSKDQSKSGEQQQNATDSTSNSQDSEKSSSSQFDKNSQPSDSNQSDPANSSGNASDSNSSDPVDHPGEAFEKIKQHLEEKKKKDQQKQSGRDSSNDSNDQSESNGAASESESNDQPATGETKDPNGERSSKQEDENQQREDASGSDSTESKQTETQDKGNSGSKSSDDSSQQKKDEGTSENEQGSGSKSDEKKDSAEKGTSRENSGKDSDGSQKKSQTQDADLKRSDTKRSESVDDQDTGNQEKNAGEQNGKDDDTEQNGKSTGSQNEDQASGDQSSDKKSGDDQGKGDSASNDKSKSSAGNSDSDEDKTGSKRSNDSTGQQESKGGKNDSTSLQDDRGEETGSQQGNKSGDKSPEKSGDKSGKKNRDSETKGDSRDDSNSKRQSSPEGAEAGKGDRDPNAATPADSSADSPGADDPNLEYSRKATEMVLDYLKDQEKNPDRELLDELKWSEAEMRDFYQKWQRMREQAEKGGAAEQRNYEEALRSLGLSPQREGIGQESVEQKKIDQLREDGTRSKPPAHLLEEFRSFNKERSRN